MRRDGGDPLSESDSTSRRHSLGVILYFWRQTAGYGVVLSLIAGVGLAAVTLASGDIQATATADAARALAVGLRVVPLILVVAGHWLGVLMHRLFHLAEIPLYLNNGWSPARLALVSWPATLVVSAAMGLLMWGLG